MTENVGKTEHNGAEHVAHVQPAEAGLVCVAAGRGWSYWFPRAEWERLPNSKRRAVKRRAIKRFAAELVEDDVIDPYADELVDQEPPAWKEWGDQ